MKIIIKIWLLMWVLATLSACQYDSILALKKHSNGFSSDGYPLKVGNSWRYQITDSISHSVDTLVLSIVKFQFNGSTKVYQCNIVKNNVLLDTQAVFELNDTLLKFYSHYYKTYFGELYLKIPFSQDSYWLGNSSFDYSYVESYLMSINVHGAIYDSVYTIHRGDDEPNYFLHEDLYLSPRYGIIKEHISASTIPKYLRQNLELIDYHIQ